MGHNGNGKTCFLLEGPQGIHMVGNVTVVRWSSMGSGGRLSASDCSPMRSLRFWSIDSLPELVHMCARVYVHVHTHTQFPIVRRGNDSAHLLLVQ